MLTILGRPRQLCDGLTRRELLRAGGTGLFGLSLPKVLAAEAAGQVGKPRAKSVIFLFLFGGPSQLETLDMKPDAPSGIRGPFQPIASRTPGLRICEHLPRLAALSDRYCVIRSVTHRHNDHNGCHYIQTGHPWPRVAANGQDVNATDKDWPAIGSALEYLDQDRGGRRDFPSYVYLPNRLGALQGYDRTGQYAGWLGRGYNPLTTQIRKRAVGDNPYARPCTDDELDFRISGMGSDAELTLDRLDRRRGLLEQFETQRRELLQGPGLVHDHIRRRAFELMTSGKMRTALDIRREPAALRDRYGRHLFGQSALMARRMVEAGARFVTVLWDSPDGANPYSWDSHQSSKDLHDFLLPGLDQTLSALVFDLDQRGLLDETLVVTVGEMGRTPRGSAQWGRGHWSYCFPAVLAGAGIRGGIVYGRSDKDAAYPVERPVSPEDLAATIFDALGIDPHSCLHDRQGRPVPLVDGGRALRELFG
jgi:hypothetical protein